MSVFYKCDKCKKIEAVDAFVPSKPRDWDSVGINIHFCPKCHKEYKELLDKFKK